VTANDESRGRAPERLETERLVLRRPRPLDAEAIFTRYASDPAVTRYVGFPRHRSVEDTRAFLELSEAMWGQWPAGPYLIEDRGRGELLGSTGLAFETPQRAATGYVLARDAWGRGFATEALGAIVGLAGAIGVRRLYALCHPGHRASAHVLEKGGFLFEATLFRYTVFPNLEAEDPGDVLCYARVFDRVSAGR
jgi:RimJ/RimL family protein N-acetyltransferase